MRAFLVTLMLVLLVLPAHAQRAGGHGKHNAGSQPTSDEQKKKKNGQQDKDYKAALDRIPDKKPADPWANMR